MRRGRSWLVGAALGVALSVLPRPGRAAGREVDWAKVFHRAQQRYDALGNRLCAEVRLDDEAPPLNLQIAAESLQIAEVFDFIARNYPDKVPERVLHVAVFVEQSVLSYERAFACAPTHEGRRTLEAASSLVRFAMQSLETLPAAAQGSHRAEFQGYLDRLAAKMPTGERRCPQPGARACEGPPPVAERAGCVVADGEGDAAALAILALGTCVARRRRATTPPSRRGTGRGA